MWDSYRVECLADEESGVNPASNNDGPPPPLAERTSCPSNANTWHRQPVHNCTWILSCQPCSALCAHSSSCSSGSYLRNHPIVHWYYPILAIFWSYFSSILLSPCSQIHSLFCNNYTVVSLLRQSPSLVFLTSICYSGNSLLNVILNSLLLSLFLYKSMIILLMLFFIHYPPKISY